MIELNKVSHDLKSNRRAVAALEYGLIAALIAVAIIGALSAVGAKLAALAALGAYL